MIDTMIYKVIQANMIDEYLLFGTIFFTMGLVTGVFIGIGFALRLIRCRARAVMAYLKAEE